MRTCEYVGESREVEQRCSRACVFPESGVWVRRGWRYRAPVRVAAAMIWVLNWECVEVIRKRKEIMRYSDFIFGRAPDRIWWRDRGGCRNEDGGGIGRE